MKREAPLIAHVVHHFGTGGMENGMVNLFNRMPPEAARHVVICLTDHGDFRQRLHRDDIDFYDLARRPGHDFKWHVDLFRLLRRLRPDILHTRNLSTLEAQFVGFLAGVPRRVHGEHGRDVFDLHGRNWKYNLLRRAARPFIHRYIAVSQDLAAWLGDTIGVQARRRVHIYNGVDHDRFHPRAGARPDLGRPEFFAGAHCVIGSLGRMAAVKNYPGLVEAFIRLCRQHPRADGLRLVLVGDGGARAQCQAMLDAAGLAAQAWLPGDRADTSEWLRAFDVFVLNSLGEGISNTILEAMASGLPVIATGVGGNPELVRPGETGLLIPPDDPATLADALGRYVNDAARRQREGEAARRRTETDFDWDRATRAYLAVYASLLQT